MNKTRHPEDLRPGLRPTPISVYGPEEFFFHCPSCGHLMEKDPLFPNLVICAGCSRAYRLSLVRATSPATFGNFQLIRPM